MTVVVDSVTGVGDEAGFGIAVGVTVGTGVGAAVEVGVIVD